MALVYLSLGTNLGNKERNLNDALMALRAVVSVIRQSNFYASKPWGFESNNDFRNAVVLIDTDLSPFEVLAKTQEIERTLGRETKTTNNYSDRVIDIDILLFENLIIDQPTLKIPHPLLAERDFVLIPLAEIAPNLEHPILRKNITELLKII